MKKRRCFLAESLSLRSIKIIMINRTNSEALKCNGGGFCLDGK